jgi:hypothetical protein
VSPYPTQRTIKPRFGVAGEFRPYKMLATLFAHGKQPFPLMISQPVPAYQSLKKGFVFHGALIQVFDRRRAASM